MALAGAVYIAWWAAVEEFLPGSFNPLVSRLVIVGLIFAGAAASYSFAVIRRQMGILFLASLWAITLHFFYLFYGNGGDSNWVVGSYITVLAIALCLPTNASLIAYSVGVGLVSIGLTIALPPLQQSVFLPGLLTILVQANLGLKWRLRAEKERLAALNLAENVQVRDEFISIASHELKTPLTALLLQVQMIQRKMGESADVRDAAALIQRQIHRFTELIDAMLDVSRISAGRFALNLEPVCLSTLVRDLVVNLRNDQIRIDLPATLQVSLDRPRIEQVVTNLLDNAIKFGEGKPIHVRLQRETNGSVLLTVQDHGVGIDAEFLPRMFSRYGRAPSARNISGLGLGMYISKQIVELHGGTLTVESEPGRGARFLVRFPVSG